VKILFRMLSIDWLFMRSKLFDESFESLLHAEEPAVHWIDCSIFDCSLWTTVDKNPSLSQYPVNGSLGDRVVVLKVRSWVSTEVVSMNLT
jgi:hypothetical protein